MLSHSNFKCINVNFVEIPTCHLTEMWVTSAELDGLHLGLQNILGYALLCLILYLRRKEGWSLPETRSAHISINTEGWPKHASPFKNLAQTMS